MNNTYYKILNEIASTFDMDQWDEQVNLFTDVIDKQLISFVHHTKYNHIYIFENWNTHDFSQFYFYKERCYINGEKVELDIWGKTENEWRNQETVFVTIEDLDQLSESCAYMFYCCRSLILVPKFDTSMVTNMKDMFFCCRSLISVPLFDTGRVTNMEDMFDECNSLSEETKQAWSSIYDFEIHRMK